MVCIVDYGGGNLFSVQRALDYLGIKNFISSSYSDIISSSKVIFPGVGTAYSTMKNLKEKGLGQSLKEVFNKGIPILGICIGSQAFLSFSEEDGGQEMLGLVSGKSKLFPKNQGVKIPHMGWNQINIVSHHPLFNGINNLENFYFVHSYYLDLEDKLLAVSKTDYAGVRFVSSYAYKNLFATQFHIEKSGENGLKILQNFYHWDGGNLC